MSVLDIDTPTRLRERAGSGDPTFVLGTGVLALLAISFPYALLWLLHPADSTYTGALFSPVDVYGYIGHMLRSANGGWALTDSFTWQDLSHPWIYPFYTLLGKMTPSGVAPWVDGLVLHLVRLGLSALFIQQAWRLYGQVLPGRAARRTALLLALFTSGVGVFWVLVGGVALTGLPYDLVSPQSSALYTLLQAPHFAASLLLVVILLRAILAVSTEGPRARWLIAGGLASLGVTLIHPDKVAVLGICSALFLAWRGLSGQVPAGALLRQALAIGLILLPGIPYTLFITLAAGSDPVLRLLTRQGVEAAAGNPLLYVVVGYGVPGLLALLAAVRLLRSPRTAPPGLVLMLSFAAGGMSLLPFNRGWHPAEGSQVAIAALAAVALVHEVLPRLWRSHFFAWVAAGRPLGYNRRRLRVLSLNLVVILAMPTTLALVFATPRPAMATPAMYFTTSDDQRALRWMNTHVPHDDVVVGTPESTEFVVAYGGARVVFGDPFFTPDYEREGQALARYFQLRSDRAGYLRARRVGWLYFGLREAEVSAFDPSRDSDYQPAYTSGSTTIYRVRLSSKQ